MEIQEEETIYDIGAERGVIGCILNHPEYAKEVAGKLSVNDFALSLYRGVYAVITKIRDEHAHNPMSPLSFDINTIVAMGKQMNIREFMEEGVGLESLIRVKNNDTTSVTAFSRYVYRVKSSSSRLSIYRAARDIQLRTLENVNEESANPLFSELESRVKALMDMREEATVCKLGDYLSSVLSEAKLVHDNPGSNPMGVYITFLPELMNLMNGIRRTQFIILFARPKVGKSTFLLNIGIDAAKQNVPVLYLDTEMNGKEQGSRALSNWSGVKEWDITGGKIFDDEATKNKVLSDAESIKNAPFYYCAAKGYTTDDIIARMEWFKENVVGDEILPDGSRRTKPCLVIYDWLKVSDSDSLNAVKEYQELGFICTALNDARCRLDIPLIAGAQANRFGNEKSVGLKAAYYAQNFLADSDRLLRFCTCLIWLRRLNEQEETIVNRVYKKDDPKYFNQMLHVVDQRGGPVSMDGMCLKLSGTTLTYKEVEYTDLSSFNEKRTDEKRQADKEEKFKKGLGAKDEQSTAEGITR